MAPKVTRGGAFAGTKAKNLVADAKQVTKADSSAAAATTPASDVVVGKDAASGDAHKLWASFTKANGDKKAASTTITEKQLKDMIYMLQRAQRITFVSLEKLETFVMREFSAADVNKDSRMDFNEFYAFYQRWLNHDADAIHKRLMSTMDDVEACFLQADTDGDMSLDRSELVAICKARTPPGEPPPEDDALAELVDDLLSEFDANGDGKFQFDEFAEAFNVMIERLSALHAIAREAMLRKKGFLTVVKDEDLEDDDLGHLEQAVRGRYEGETWVVREGEISSTTAATAAATPRGFGNSAARHGVALNVLAQARKAKSIPLLLKHPDQPFDNIAQHYVGRSEALMLDVEKLLLETGRADKPLTSRGFAAAVADAIVECMLDGRVCVLRLGQSSPDFALAYNFNDVLPYGEVFAEYATNLQPGPLPEALHAMVTTSRAYTGQTPASVVISPTFQLVFASQYSMMTFRSNLRGHLPLQALQPVQVVSSLSQCAAVLRDPRKHCPEVDVNDAIAMMDRLADML